MTVRDVLVCLLLLALAPLAYAHEVRPAAIEMAEAADGAVDILWRQPIAGEYTISIAPLLSAGWLDGEPDTRYTTEQALIKQWHVTASDVPLAGQRLSIRGLDRTITDVMVQIRYANGREFSTLIKPVHPELEIPDAATSTPGLPRYLVLGVEHIWSGYDHLLYVLGLILLIHSLRALLITITTFTVAHSITLACAAFGLVRLQPAAVEAVIALSIVYVAVELVKVARGQPSLASHAPWLIAFCFGLLHGFGFAGALRDIGLPADAVTRALLLFNIGIEIGQVAFVIAVTVVLLALRGMLPTAAHTVRTVAPYLIGSLASFWLLQRLALPG
ncbi:MAG: HupE/UreJ family protein [Gammaproteobacteria bacterium]|nr:HupE/UreJ family protein [Gammaproteobacteria bacterium]